jgi:HK97 family phage prohead protease
VDPEIRTFDIRSEPEGGRIIRGYAAVFDSPTNLGPFLEVIDRHAFDGANLSDVRLLWSHDTARVLGRAGINLSLAVDEAGLAFRCELPETNDGRDAYELIRSGIVDECSFGFFVGKEQWDEEGKTRTILQIKALPEITVCAWGAYPQTVVEPVEPAAEEPPPNTPDLGLLAQAYEME